MNKLTDEQIDNLYINGTKHWIGKREIARAIEAAATEPLLQRISELEKENAKLKTLPMKYRRMTFNAELQENVKELERQLEDARNQALEEAANAVDAMKAPDGYGIQEQSLYDVATMEAADVVRALKGAKG